jgi:hypothetical protein
MAQNNRGLNRCLSFFSRWFFPKCGICSLHHLAFQTFLEHLI